MTQAPSSNWRKVQQTLEKDRPRDDASGRSIRRKARHDYLDNASTNDVDVVSRGVKRKAELVAAGDVTELDLKRAYGGDGLKSERGAASAIGSLLSEASLTSSQRQAGRYLAIDCEMVGVGFKGSQSVLARVSIVNFHGATLLDKYVKPKEVVTDWRTWISGIRKEDIEEKGEEFEDVQMVVAAMIKNRILVGHALHNDLGALLLTHPAPLIRDTSKFEGGHKLLGTKQPSLKKLAKECLDIEIQKGRHDSVDDAKITMLIYRHFKKTWESRLNQKGHHLVPDPNDPTRLLW